jgi:hypothetical protein
METLEKLALKKKVRAALLENHIGLSSLRLEIPEKGLVEISGVTHTSKRKAEIPEIIKRVSGVAKLQDEIELVVPEDAPDL